jgi:hypothetical protein
LRRSARLIKREFIDEEDEEIGEDEEISLGEEEPLLKA